ncbi:MAG: acyltransferase, partial [Candidatus Rokuibacteriota bacterium]
MLATAMGYRLVRGFIRLLLRLFYRRVNVVGAARIPAAGPLIIAANHHNSLVDPMLIMGTFPRRITVLAKAPLFRHPLIGPFLHAVGALPVNRRAEAGEDPPKNEAMFAAAIAHLRGDGAILIFPEGRTQPVPTLLPLRTGAARLLLGAKAPAGRITLLPVGLVFETPGTFREASALVAIGPPVSTDDCLAGYAAEPEATVRRLTERLASAIRA